MNFQQLILILKARWKVVLAIFVLIAGAAIGITAAMPNKYTATAAVLAESRSSDPLFGALMAGQPTSGYIATQVDIISSDRVAQRVVRALGIDKNPDAIARWKDEGEGLGTVESFYADRIQRALDVAPSRESSVISINFSSPDPKFAAVVANAFARAYIDTSLELKVEPAKEYAQWFVGRTKLLRENLEAAQAKLSAYQREKGIVATEERLDMENTRLSELTSQLALAQAQKTDTSSRERQAQDNMRSSPDVLQNPVVASLRSEVLRQEARLRELAEQLGANHPQYQRAATQLSELTSKLDGEMRRVAASMGTAKQAGNAREAELRALIDAQKKRMLGLRAERDEIVVLQRDVENAQRAFDLVTQQLSKTSLESQTQQTNIALLTPAVEPIKPSGPKVVRNIALGVFVGLMLGIGAALFLEFLDPRVRATDDLRSVVGVPVLASLRQTSAKQQSRFFRSAKRPSPTRLSPA